MKCFTPVASYIEDVDISHFKCTSPDVFSNNFDVQAIINGNVTLECQGISDPPPKIDWTLPNGQTMSSSTKSNIHKTISKLSIRNVQLEDAGFYTCTATNLLGSSSKVISLTVSRYIVNSVSKLCLEPQSLILNILSLIISIEMNKIFIL